MKLGELKKHKKERHEKEFSGENEFFILTYPQFHVNPQMTKKVSISSFNFQFWQVSRILDLDRNA